MAKESYSDTKLHGSTKRLLGQITDILGHYESEGYRMTVRQVYYQLVTRNILPNNMASYRRTSKVITTGRMNGLIDWDTIIDRARVPVMPSEFPTGGHFLEAVKSSYRSQRWADQDNYLEVMVEKEALAGILEPVTRKYHVSLLVNKGYASASAMYHAAKRISSQMGLAKSCHVLYLGDHDPSGMDMVRDVRNRLRTFHGIADVERIALNEDQIREYQLPPNPAKRSDPRARKYCADHGSRSWELDALDPRVLSHILESAIQKYLDVDRYNDILDWEQEERGRFDDIVDGWPAPERNRYVEFLRRKQKENEERLKDDDDW